MKKNRGFTLLELLVVICIILILMALLVVLIKHVITRSRYAKTNSIVQTLESSCKTYRTEFGGFPPVTLYGQGNSRNLHHHLGVQRILVKGTQTGGGGIITRSPGYIDFDTSWIQGHPPSGYPNPPMQIVDAWDNPLAYFNPSPNAPPNVPSFRLFATGNDVLDPADDVASDIRDY